MNQREEVLRAWKERSKTAYRSPHFAKAKAFFEFVEQRQDICWDELVSEFRNNYRDAIDEITSVLIDTDDPLIMYNFVRYADPSNPKEAEAVKSFLRKGDAGRHEVSLQAAARVPEMQTELKKRAKLPDSVRETLGLKKPKPPAPVEK